MPDCEIRIAEGAIVGYNSNVASDLDERHGIYINRPNPWASLQMKMDSTHKWYIPVPETYREYEFDENMLRKYLPNYRPA